MYIAVPMKFVNYKKVQKCQFEIKTRCVTGIYANKA